MRNKIIACSILYFFISILWFITKDGISPTLLIQRKDAQVLIYFDGHLLGAAREKMVEKRTLNIVFKDQDLKSKYFSNKSFSTQNNLSLPSKDFTLQTNIHNPFAVRLSFENDKPYVFYFNPYRHLNSGWEDPHNILTDKHNFQVQISMLQGLLWCLWLILAPFPYVSCIFFFIIGLFILQKKHITHPTIQRDFGYKLFFIPILIGAASFIWSYYLMKYYLGSVPHVPDAVSYILSAKILASGNFVIPISELPSFLPSVSYKDYFHHWFTFKDKYMFIYYPLGHPFLLAIGEIFKSMHLIPPLVGSAVLILIYYCIYSLTRSIFFATIGALLCFSSPFFQTQTIDYMSHNTASLYLLLALVPILFFDRKYYWISGLFLGLLLNTRPLTFAVCALCIGAYSLVLMFKRKDLKDAFIKIKYGTLGFLPPLILYFSFNYITTGDILTSPYLYHGILNKVGLGDEFKIGYGLLHGFSNLAVFSLFFLKNYFISFLPFVLSFLLLPFASKNRSAILLLQTLSIGIICVWFLYDGNFFMYGPRFIYEAVPVLAILYGLTFYHLYKIIRTLAFAGIYKFIGIVYMALVMVIYMSHIVLFEAAWLGFTKSDYTDIFYVPSNINELKGFNYVDGRIKKYTDSLPPYNKIIIMKKCKNWWCTGEGVWMNTFPMNKSSRIILTMPDEYKNEIKGAKIIDWEKLD